MIRIGEYLNDGANWQAQAVLAYIRGNIAQFREGSWNPLTKEYEAEVWVGRYENGREQGYVVSVMYRWRKQITFAFYEHQNADRLNVRHYNGTFGTDTPSGRYLAERYGSKSNFDKDFKCGEIKECGEYIINEIKKYVDEWVTEDAEYFAEMIARANAIKELRNQYVL